MTTTELKTGRTYTATEYLALPNDGKEYELVKGNLVEMPALGFIHGLVISRLAAFLGTAPNGQSVVGTAFVLDQETVLRPSVAFVINERLAGIDYLDAFPGPPDLAVEVISRTDLIFDVDEKIALYVSKGVKLVWVINPKRRTVEVFHPGDPKPTVLAGDEELDGENLIPGFKLAINRLFE